MATVDKWTEVVEALDRLETHRVLGPTLAAMRRLVTLIQADAAFADVKPTVSLATLVLASGRSSKRICVSWKDGVGYEVAEADPQMNLADTTPVGEEAIVRYLQERLSELKN